MKNTAHSRELFEKLTNLYAVKFSVSVSLRRALVLGTAVAVCR